MVSGIPHEHLRRKVIIYSPARTATQQGSGKVGKWKINFMSTQKWENPLMGWTSTGDPYANVGDAGLSFDSDEAAKAFAEKHGWDYVVKKRHTPMLKAKAYADNFKWKGPQNPMNSDCVEDLAWGQNYGDPAAITFVHLLMLFCDGTELIRNKHSLHLSSF
ncbi:unnamed protein product [Spirodela intermedia]|uniref:NADH dehydrogenase [ubiquinone] iron-sulfur protein 4, mitochondrial n=1 Tax=Spirodela intermedia TaxID=51605 RepID=A0A7I8IKL5_SPIIN|nr:unnamed protein product [Spirodela intermedia]CAA6657537.1 unnamed protein product [Spirodela intermedia]